MKHVQQPCNQSCGFASLAMITDVPIETLFAQWPNWEAERGISLKSALSILALNGFIGIPQPEPFHFEAGRRYLVSVFSRNIMATGHYVAIDIDHDGVITVGDPNYGRPDKKWYSSFDELSMIDVLRIFKITDILV